MRPVPHCTAHHNFHPLPAFPAPLPPGVVGGLSILTLGLAAALVFAVARIYGWTPFRGKRWGWDTGAGGADSKKGDVETAIEMARPGAHIPSIVTTRLMGGSTSGSVEPLHSASSQVSEHSAVGMLAAVRMCVGAGMLRLAGWQGDGGIGVSVVGRRGWLGVRKQQACVACTLWLPCTRDVADPAPSHCPPSPSRRPITHPPPQASEFTQPGTAMATAASSASPLRKDASWRDCLIEPEQIQILRRRDGRPWVLGGGAFGQVYKALYDGVQVRVCWQATSLAVQLPTQTLAQPASPGSGAAGGQLAQWLTR